MVENKKISQEFIQEKYMQLLEESYVTFQNKSKFQYLKKTALFLSVIFVIGIGFYITKYSTNNNLIQFYLSETTFNNKDILLKLNNKFYKIPQDKSLSYKESNGITVKITPNQISFLATDGYTFKNHHFTIHTPKNKTYKVELPDLSKITINNNTELSFNLFNKDNVPNVTLIGEAFFNIAKQYKGTFKILANNMNIEVVGTEFNINNYNNTAATQLSLVEGIVKINHNNNENYVHAGEQASLNSDNYLSIKNKDFSNELAWIQNSFDFENKPLVSIAKIIENWYHVKFKFNNSKLKNIYLTGTINKEKGLTHFLQMLKYTEELQYIINKNTITLKK